MFWISIEIVEEILFLNHTPVFNKQIAMKTKIEIPNGRKYFEIFPNKDVEKYK